MLKLLAKKIVTVCGGALILAITADPEPVMAGTLSCEDAGDCHVLRNGLVEVAVAKASGNIVRFERNGFAPGNLATTAMQVSSKEQGDGDNPRKHECHWEPPRQTGGQLRLVMRQNWDYVDVEEQIILPADKPYCHVRHTLTPKINFFSKNVMATIFPSSGLDTRITDNGSLSKFNNSRKNEWRQYDKDFAKGGWVAFQSSASREGIAILFNDFGVWGDFLNCPPWEKDGAEGFSLQLLNPLGKDKPLTPEDRIMMDFCILAFTGDAQVESEKCLKEYREKAPGLVDSGARGKILQSKIVSAVKTTTPPVIDGTLDDECWKKASQASNFQISHSQGEPPVNQTQVSFCYDDNNLYFSFIAFDIKMALAKANERLRDGLVWQDDDIELFLMPDNASGVYYQFAWNMLGTEFDARASASPFKADASWNAKIKSKTLCLEDRWQGEIAIPWSDISFVPSEGMCVGLDVCRSKLSRVDSPAEASNLFKSPTGVWHRPADFGHMALTGVNPLPSLMVENQVALAKSRTTETVKLRLSDTIDEFRTVKVSVEGENGAVFRSSRIVRTKDSREVDIPFFTKEKGNLKFRVSLADAENDRVVFSNDFGLLSKYGNAHRPEFFLETPGYFLWSTGAVTKITPDDELEKRGQKQGIELSLAKNEYEPFQIVVTPKETGAVKQFRLEFSDLKNGENLIAREHVTWNPEGYIKVDKPSPLPDAFAGSWPDPLLEDRIVVVDEKRHYPVWVTVYAPLATPAGVYAGEVRLIVDDTVAATIPLKVKVWNFALPDTSFFDAIYDVWFYGPLKEKAKFSDILENIKRHKGAGAGRVPDTNPDTMERSYREYFEKYGMRHVWFPGFAGEGPWKNRRSFYGQRIEPKNEEFRKLFIDETRKLVDMFKRNGWYDKVIFWLWDEPFLATDPELRENLPLWGKLVREAAPDIKIMLTHYLSFDKELNSPNDMDGIVDVLNVPLYFGPLFNPQLAERWKEKGMTVLGYHNQWYLTDCPALKARIFPWILWSSGIKGSVVWSVNSWTIFKYDPWNYGNDPVRVYRGDGFLLYPNKTNDRLLNSIRWELLRDGLEDYDYLYLCQQALAGGKLSAAQQQRAQELLSMPGTFAQSFEKCTRNPEDIARVREQLGDFLDTLH